MYIAFHLIYYFLLNIYLHIVDKPIILLVIFPILEPNNMYGNHGHKDHKKVIYLHHQPYYISNKVYNHYIAKNNF